MTEDTDFGELVFRDHRPSPGVILLRISNDLADGTAQLLRLCADDEPALKELFVTVTGERARTRRLDDR